MIFHFLFTAKQLPTKNMVSKSLCAFYFYQHNVHKDNILLPKNQLNNFLNL